jgi:hypothetical protein
MKKNSLFLTIALAMVFFVVGSVSAKTSISDSSISPKADNLASYVANDSFKPILGDQDFILINSTGVEIFALYVTPHTAGSWGDDVLGVDTLPAGDETTIIFAPNEKVTYWDLRIEDEDGNYIEWYKFNLKKISTIELFYKNGKATAIYN